MPKSKRYTLNVSKEVYATLMDLRSAELRRSDKAPTADELLRRLLKLGPAKEVKSP